MTSHAWWLIVSGMFTVQDVIHLIQYYYHTSSWEGAAADVEGLRLTSIRGQPPVYQALREPVEYEPQLIM